MGVFERLNFDSVLDEGGAFDPSPVDPSFLQIVTKIEQAAGDGNLVATKEAFTALSLARPGTEWVKRPGSALIIAIGNNHEDVIEYLLSQGVEIGPYHARLATTKKARPILDLLVKYGYDLNRQTEWAVPPPLAFAVEDIDLCLWFLSHGADPNAPCAVDTTPLSAAVQDGSREVIDLLFAHGGSIERGQLLHFAIWRNHEDRLGIVTYLLDKGAPFNELMYYDRPNDFELRRAFGLGTPLHAAAAEGDQRIVELLINKGADARIRDSLGTLPYQRAERNGHQAVADYLRAQAGYQED